MPQILFSLWNNWGSLCIYKDDMDAHTSSPPHTSSLPADTAELQRLIDALQGRESHLLAALEESSQTIAAQQDTIEKLSHELALLKRHVFGYRRERFAEDARQQHLFEVQNDPSAALPAVENADEPAVRKRRGHGRRPLPQFLPRKRVEHELPAEQLACPCCGEPREKIDEEMSEQLAYVPASLYIEEHARFTYACRKCQEQVATAPRPAQPIEKSVAGASLLAYVIDAKYAQHKPLYRLEDDLARYGVLIRRSTLWGWMRGSAECVAPFNRLMIRRALGSDVLGTDDTPVKVLDPELDHTRTGRFWTYVGDAHHPYTVYDYTPNHKREGPQKFLKDYRGVLQADGFNGYDGIFWTSRGSIVEAGCNAHARRKFFDARETSPQLAHEALAFFQQLYAVEYEAADMSDDERLTLRQAKSAPIMAALADWLREKLVVVRPKSPITKAIKYSLRQWDALRRFLDNGSIPIDNNRSERALKEQALGRKNWIFLGSDQGGSTAAVLYSLVASAKRHHLDPQAYLTDVLTRLPQIANPLELRHLLPDRWAKAHPEHVRTYRRQESAAATRRRQSRHRPLVKQHRCRS
jgi:transposase